MSRDASKDWTLMPLKSLFSLQTPGFWGGEPHGFHDVKVLRATNLTKDNKLNLNSPALRSFPERKREQKELQNNDIILERSGGSPSQPVGRVGFFEGDSGYSVSNFMQILRIDTHIGIPKFCYYLMAWLYEKGVTAKLQKATTGIRNLDYAAYLNTEVYIPSLHEQRRIAEILSSVDDAIAATQAMIEQTKKVKQATLEHLLTKGIGHTRFKQTEIGEIPESWDVAELNSVATFQPGYAFKSNQFVDEGVRLLRGSNIGVGSFDWSEGATKYFPEDRVVEFSEYFLRENDIIIAMDRPFISSGFKVARLQKSDLPCLLLQRVGRLTPKVNCDPDWLWQITSAGSVRSHLEKQQVGTDLPHISKSDIESCKIVIPTLSEQKAIASILMPLDANIETLMKILHTSKSMKSALMSDLLTGRKRVTDTLPLAAE